MVAMKQLDELKRDPAHTPITFFCSGVRGAQLSYQAILHHVDDLSEVSNDTAVLYAFGGLYASRIKFNLA